MYRGLNIPPLSLPLRQHLMLTQSGGTFIEECTVATLERNFPIFPSPVCMSCSQEGRQEVGLSLRNEYFHDGCVTPSSLLPRTPPNGIGVPPNLLEVCDGSFH